jgi:hypothetical protein
VSPRKVRAGAPSAPQHLSVEVKRWWREVVATYDLEAHHPAAPACQAVRHFARRFSCLSRHQPGCPQSSDHGGALGERAGA